MSRAGCSAASFLTRLAAGCRRICSASNDSASPSWMTSSPSTARRSTARVCSADTMSGKNRASDLPDRPLSSTSAPALNARQRKPSHFGSNCQPGPSGRSATGLASIGATSRSTGSRDARLAIQILNPWRIATFAAARPGGRGRIRASRGPSCRWSRRPRKCFAGSSAEEPRDRVTAAPHHRAG